MKSFKNYNEAKQWLANKKVKFDTNEFFHWWYANREECEEEGIPLYPEYVYSVEKYLPKAMSLTKDGYREIVRKMEEDGDYSKENEMLYVMYSIINRIPLDGDPSNFEVWQRLKEIGVI